jgi:hypothetical protein
VLAVASFGGESASTVTTANTQDSAPRRTARRKEPTIGRDVVAFTVQR